MLLFQGALLMEFISLLHDDSFDEIVQAYRFVWND